MSGDHPARKKLPDTRSGTRYSILVESAEGDIPVYILINRYEDTGDAGEIFANVSKQGSTLQGMLDGWCIMASFALQYGVPLEKIVEKFKGQAFPPSGKTNHPDVKECLSLLDLIARILEFDAATQKRG